MSEQSPRFGNGRTTWSSTYQRLFRSMYPGETWHEVEKQSTSVRNPIDGQLNGVSTESREAQPHGVGRQDSSPRTEAQTSKRVSINEDEARSQLSKRQNDQYFSDSWTHDDVDNAIFDDDVCAYVRDVVEREFPHGGIKLAVIDQSRQPIETVFNKTISLTRNDKIVYVHLRNHIRTSIRQRQNDRAFINSYEEVVSPTSFSIARTEFPRRRSIASENNDDELTHTNASSWSGPHKTLPVPTSVTSSNQANNLNRYYVPQNIDDDVETCGVHLLSSDDCRASWNEEAILRRKAEQGELLNRGELLYLKKLHCARVVEDENELLSLLCQPLDEGELNIQHLRRRLDASYKAYESSVENRNPNHKGKFAALDVILAH
ncbi:unnamed protein product [Angiostrongylus costaricensis]|uniref:Ras-associating domain-containing protein n=1 Tax=Angiostrongylus costaricensis TaxID=334426 RepID=A0A158PD35_ANGCS|nr:unnamed protein product [Angiostrongylus costaricensis]